jgi:hypothetical protein
MPEGYLNRYDTFFDIIPSDTQTVQGPNRADGLPTPYCNGFLALTDGNLTARSKAGHALAARTFPVIAGTVYDIGLSYVYTTSTATIMGLL